MAAFDADYYIEKLGMTSHPEGGYFKESFRSATMLPASALPSQFGGDRSAATAIYFLLKAGFPSHFHRIRSDEIWHFYAGDPVEVFGIHPDGRLQIWLLGPPEIEGAVFQAVVPAEVWFGSAVLARKSNFSLCGCTVAPGFDFSDYELAERAALTAAFPQHAAMIARLTRLPLEK